MVNLSCIHSDEIKKVALQSAPTQYDAWTKKRSSVNLQSCQQCGRLSWRPRLNPLILIMIVRWFDASAAKRFGQEMAQLVATKSSTLSSTGFAKSEKKIGKAYESALFLVEKKLGEFRKTNKLNVYTKAQLGSAFKHGLLDSGFDLAFAEMTTTWLLLKCK